MNSQPPAPVSRAVPVVIAALAIVLAGVLTIMVSRASDQRDEARQALARAEADNEVLHRRIDDQSDALADAQDETAAAVEAAEQSAARATDAEAESATLTSDLALAEAAADQALADLADAEQRAVDAEQARDEAQARADAAENRDPLSGSSSTDLRIDGAERDDYDSTGVIDAENWTFIEEIGVSACEGMRAGVTRGTIIDIFVNDGGFEPSIATMTVDEIVLTYMCADAA